MFYWQNRFTGFAGKPFCSYQVQPGVKCNQQSLSHIMETPRKTLHRISLPSSLEVTQLVRGICFKNTYYSSGVGGEIHLLKYHRKNYEVWKVNKKMMPLFWQQMRICNCIKTRKSAMSAYWILPSKWSSSAKLIELRYGSRYLVREQKIQIRKNVLD